MLNAANKKSTNNTALNAIKMNCPVVLVNEMRVAKYQRAAALRPPNSIKNNVAATLFPVDAT